MGDRSSDERLGRVRPAPDLRGRCAAGDGAAAPLIDLHCHILPALDDGAIDIEDSVAMARQAADDGIDVVCATPHIHPDHKIGRGELAGRVAALNERLEQEGLPTRVVPGGEVAEPMLPELDDADLRTVSLGQGGRWLLLEPRPGPLGDHLVEAVESLAERGFRTIVAHPERHPSADFRARLEAVCERGALVQVTAALVAGGPAAPTMLDLAHHGLVHLLGSDAHSSHGGRPVALSSGLARLVEIERLAPHSDWIVRAGPAAIIRGEDVHAPFASC